MSRTHIPYTYCITHKPSGKRYYGARYANGCHPDDLWVKYFTSSKTIKGLIKLDGKEAFSIEVRRIFKTAEACVEWESKVLRRLDVTYNTNWLNLMVNKSVSQEEMKHIVFERYGYEHALQVPEFRAKSKATMLEKYGVENSLENPDILAKMRENFLATYGVKNPLELPENILKSKQTLLAKYGVDNSMKVPEVKQKLQQTNLKNWGFTSYAKTDVFRSFMRQKRKDSTPVECPKCGIISVSFGMLRFHFDNCKEIPIICMETGKTFRSAVDAANSVVGYTSSVSNIASMIRQACRKENNYVYGFHWKYEKD